MSDKVIECTRCRWYGLESRTDRIPTDAYKPVKAWDNVCPKCGHGDFYLRHEINKNNTLNNQ